MLSKNDELSKYDNRFLEEGVLIINSTSYLCELPPVGALAFKLHCKTSSYPLAVLELAPFGNFSALIISPMKGETDNVNREACNRLFR